MKRSEINAILRDAKAFLASRQFYLPEWANWSLADWKANKDKVAYITERMLG
ncbi:MAG: D-lyxose/D-mannose family sugar isomerase, partial [Bacteroidaceae bacterium]|nr:D-lyxose/D-mannose family sugar isomerase [Bacteroidaceae bacterium]